MAESSLQSADHESRALTLFTTIQAGFSRPGGPQTQTLQNLLKTIKPIGLSLYKASVIRKRSLLGEGASYRVLRCEDDQGSVFAVKQIKLPLEDSCPTAFARRVASVLRDIEVMRHASLARHENILSLLGYGWGFYEDSRLPYLVTELSDHKSLRQYLTLGGSKNLTQRYKLCCDVASGLHALHLSGFAHGDLKLENVLVFLDCNSDSAASRQKHRPRAKLSDFAQSCVLSQDQAFGTSQRYHGTMWYLAPELYATEKHSIEPRKCDMWALGLLIWECLAGGKRYLDMPPIKEARSNISLAPSQCQILPRSSLEQTAFELCMHLARIATDFARTSLHELFITNRHCVFAILHKTLQVEVSQRCDDVSKLPFAYSTFSLTQPAAESVRVDSPADPQEVQIDARWDYEVFYVDKAASFPHRTRSQLVREATSSAVDESNDSRSSADAGLYVAMAYANGFGVERNIDTFWLWARRSASGGCLAAESLITICESPRLVTQVFAKELSRALCASHDLSTLWIPENQAQCAPNDTRLLRNYSILHALALATSAKNDALLAAIAQNTAIRPLLEPDIHSAGFMDLVIDANLHMMTAYTESRQFLCHGFPLRLAGPPLAFAICLRNIPYAQALLDKGAIPIHNISERTDLERHSPLHAAVSTFDVAMFQLLWNACLNIFSENILYHLFISDELRGGYLVAALGQRSVGERLALHGTAWQEVQERMIITLLDKLHHLQQKYKQPSDSLAAVLHQAVAFVLRYEDIYTAEKLYSSLEKTMENSKVKDASRQQVISAALRTAITGTLDVPRAAEYIKFVYKIREGPDSEMQVCQALITNRQRALLLHQLNFGLSFNFSDNEGKTPLHHMIRTGFSSAIPLHILIAAAGASIHSADKHGITPLHLAASGGYTSLVDSLLKAGADPSTTDIWGHTVLFHAVETSKVEIIHLIIHACTVEHGPNHYRTWIPCESKMKEATQSNNLCNQLNSFRGIFEDFPLHRAAELGYVEVVVFLLKIGAPVNALDAQHNFPLHKVLRNKAIGVGTTVSCARALCDAGASLTGCNISGETPLHTAANRGGEDQLNKIFLELKEYIRKDIDAKNSSGRSVLFAASSLGDRTVVSSLLELGASCSVLDSQGRTVLHECVIGAPRDASIWSETHVKIVDMLVQAGVNIYAEDELAMTALDYAAVKDNVTITNHLLKNVYFTTSTGPDPSNTINPKDSHGRDHILSSAWKHAVQASSWAVVKQMLMHEFGEKIDKKILRWPAGVRLLRHAVMSTDSDLLFRFGLHPRPPQLYDLYSGTDKERAASTLDRRIERYKGNKYYTQWSDIMCGKFETKLNTADIHAGGDLLHEITDFVLSLELSLLIRYLGPDCLRTMVVHFCREKESAPKPHRSPYHKPSEAEKMANKSLPHGGSRQWLRGRWPFSPNLYSFNFVEPTPTPTPDRLLTLKEFLDNNRL